MPSSGFDVVVVGAGPAGLAAAASAAGAGCTVALLDSAAQPGGQYWRHPPGRLDDVAHLHHDLPTFTALGAAALRHATALPRHHVWTIIPTPSGFDVHALRDETSVVVSGASVVLAPGAYDRQLPFPGWDLPGVFAAGGAQALLKGHEVLVGRRVVVGGTGPFLLSVAAGLSAYGATVVGVFEANHPATWLRHPAAVAGAMGKLAEGTGYVTTLARHRVRVHPRHAVVAALGDGHVDGVTVAELDARWNVVAGSQRTIECDAVAVGWGFVPQLELSLALGCDSRVDVDGSLITVVDEHQASSIPGVYVAGEAAGVGGAALALVEGEIAGRAAADWLRGRVTRPSARLRRRRRAQRRFAMAMHLAHPVRDGWRTWLSPDTLVCRCEQVAVSAITDATQLGADDARTVKLLSRAGMGWCQGRMCGYAVSCLAAATAGRDSDSRGLAERPLATPIRLGVLAQSDDDGAPDQRPAGT